MRILALDYGRASCGCAISDPTETLATPIAPVSRPATEAGLERIAALAGERDVECIVIGLPLSLAGGDSAQTVEAREFAALVSKRLPGVAIELYDERLTTRQARRTGGAASEDSRSAAHLLEAWLARRHARAG